MPLRHAPIIANGGILLLEGLIADEYLVALQQECMHARADASEQRSNDQNSVDYRDGKPSRWLLSAEGGPVQMHLYNDPVLNQNLSVYCGRSVTPTGQKGSYSYYETAGHFLGIHRDIPGCDVALITCLYRDDKESESGILRVYYKDFASELSNIRKKASSYRDINMKQGQSVLLLGGWIPHEVLPSSQGHKRYISVLCYAFSSDDTNEACYRHGEIVLPP